MKSRTVFWIFTLLILCLGYSFASGAAQIKFLYKDVGGTYTQVEVKGSWNVSGGYDAAWSGGNVSMYDDGTNGDAVAGDHIWTRIMTLQPNGGAKTWQWGAVNQDGNWIITGSNPKFEVIDHSPQTVSYPKTMVTFIYYDKGATYTGVQVKGSWDADGKYDASWTGGNSAMYDDGTNGDEIAGDHIWTRIMELVQDAGVATWQWGAVNQDGGWIISGSNPSFTLPNSMAQTQVYPKMTKATFVYSDTTKNYVKVEVKGSWDKMGEYNASWTGGTSSMFDDGTHGDKVAGDHIWTRELYLKPDDGVNGWQWGAIENDGSQYGKWIIKGSNPKFIVKDQTPITMSWPWALVTFAYTDETAALTGVKVKGSWNAKGEYNASWSGGNTAMSDSGTFGDIVIGDHVWNREMQLVPDGGTNTWEWGAVDQNGAWLIKGANPQLKVVNSMAVSASYPMKTAETAEITFLYKDIVSSLTAVKLKGSWSQNGSYDAGWGGGAVSMYDDGTNGDEVAGDHTWTRVMNLVPDGGVKVWEWSAEDQGGNDIVAGANRQFLMLNTEKQLLVYPTTPAAITFIIDDTKDGNYITGCSLKGTWDKTTGKFDAAWGGNPGTQKMFDDGTHGDVAANDHIWTLIVDLVPDSNLTAPNSWQWGAVDQDGKWLPEQNQQFKLINNNEQTLTYLLPQTGQLATAYVYFQVDMAAYIEMGIFDVSRGDSVQLRGEFNSWSGSDIALTRMGKIPGTTIYELLVPITDFTGSKVEYKYYLQLSQASKDYWASHGYSYINDAWYWAWEQPHQTGGGNRTFVFTGDANNVQELPLDYFNQVDPKGVISAGKTVRVTFTADMTGKTPFTPGSDTLKLVLTEKWQQHLLGLINTSNGVPIEQSTAANFTGSGNTYSLTLDFKGPIAYSLLYQVQYKNADVPNPISVSRTRYILPATTDPVTWPSDYAYPVDKFTEATIRETPPAIATAVEPVEEAKPYTFVLKQNYPNPFNPKTQIDFTIPTPEKVDLVIYNMLGQVVRSISYAKLPAGTHTYIWDGKDERGLDRASGIYIYQLKAGDKFSAHKKMLLVR